MIEASTISTVVLLGLSASGLTQTIRALVPQSWLLHKPLSCDLCMSFWTSLTTCTVMVLQGEIDFRHPVGAIVFFASMATAVLTTKTAVRLSV